MNMKPESKVVVISFFSSLDQGLTGKDCAFSCQELYTWLRMLSLAFNRVQISLASSSPGYFPASAGLPL
jgi:hypothetical protein